MSNISYAYYDSHAQARQAIAELRAAGVRDDDISVLGRNNGEVVFSDAEGDTVEATKDIAGKAALGSGVGALLGVAALAIPGVGPFVAAGAIAQAAVGGAAVAGTALGAAAGGLAGALQDHGISEEDAVFYNERLDADDDGVLITVNRSPDYADRYDTILYDAGGYTATRYRAVA